MLGRGLRVSKGLVCIVVLSMCWLNLTAQQGQNDQPRCSTCKFHYPNSREACKKCCKEFCSSSLARKICEVGCNRIPEVPQNQEIQIDPLDYLFEQLSSLPNKSHEVCQRA